MPGFVVKLIAPRPTFAFDMSADERTMMMQHAGYWAGLAKGGSVLAYGPVADPVGAYGIGIIVAADLAAVEAMRDSDPAILSGLGFSYDIAPMLRLVTPTASYDA